MVLVTLLSLAPRYIAKTIQCNFFPNDLDIVRYIRKMEPYHHFNDSETHLGIGLVMMKENRGRTQTSSIRSRRGSVRSMRSRASSFLTVDDMPEYLRSDYIMDIRMQSMTDMSTGVVSVDRGFDFATEENGVALQRIQTNLTERRSSRMPPPDSPSPPLEGNATSPGKKSKERHAVLDSLKGMVRRKGTSSRPTTADEPRGPSTSS